MLNERGSFKTVDCEESLDRERGRGKRNETKDTTGTDLANGERSDNRAR